MRRLLAAVVVVAGAASSVGARQAPPPRDSQRLQTPIAPPSGTGRLAGRVIAADGGEPLRNARVSLSPAAGDVPLVLTDGDGRFAFTGLPAGTYAVSAAKAGYAVPDGAAPVQLAEGARADVSVRLARGAAIAGRLLDEAGEPLPNANVLVEQLVETGGVRSTRARRAVQTNDIGEYRVGSLPAGVYVVSVVTPPQVQILGTGATGIALQLPPAAGRPANGPGGPVNLADVGPSAHFLSKRRDAGRSRGVTGQGRRRAPLRRSVWGAGPTPVSGPRACAGPIAHRTRRERPGHERDPRPGSRRDRTAERRPGPDHRRCYPAVAAGFHRRAGPVRVHRSAGRRLHLERQEESLHRSRVWTGRHFRSGYAHYAGRRRTSRSRGHHVAPYQRDRRPADRRVRRSDRGRDDSPVSDPVCVRAPAAGRCAGCVEFANRRSRTLSCIRLAARFLRARRLRRAARARAAGRTRHSRLRHDLLPRDAEPSGVAARFSDRVAGCRWPELRGLADCDVNRLGRGARCERGSDHRRTASQLEPPFRRARDDSGRRLHTA